MGEARDELARLIPLINASPRAAGILETWSRKMRLELEGESKPFFIVIENGKMRLEDKLAGEPDMIMQGSAAEFAKFARGEKDITHPIGHGQIRLTRGKSLELVIFMSRIFGAVHRKKLEAA